MPTYTIECTRSDKPEYSVSGLQCHVASSQAVFDAPGHESAFQVAQAFCVIRGVWSIRIKPGKGRWLKEIRCYDNRGLPESLPIRGAEIRRTRMHDAGAIAQCGACLRYSDDPKSLYGNFPCACGKSGYWSGSFKPPTASSMWSDTLPITSSR